MGIVRADLELRLRHAAEEGVAGAGKRKRKAAAVLRERKVAQRE